MDKRIRDLYAGDIFEFKDADFIKTNLTENGMIICLYLRDGNPVYLYPFDIIKPINKRKNKMYERIGLGDLIKEYHIHLHNIPLDVDDMSDWGKDENLLREKLNFFINIDKQALINEFGENKMSVQEKIAKLEKELAALKEECAKYEPKVGNWAVSGMGRIEHIQALRNWYLTAGRLFDTEEKAEKARDIMIKHDIILKYVIDHAPDWEPNWNNYDEIKWFVYYDKEEKSWEIDEFVAVNPFGMIVMPKWVAEKLADDLNNNRIDLEPCKK